MLLGAEPTAPAGPPVDFIAWEKEQEAKKKAGVFGDILPGDWQQQLARIPDVPPLARAVLPLAVVFLVQRKDHPIIWWVLGMGPLAWAAKDAIIQQRLWGPPKVPAAPPASTIRK